MVRSLRLTLAIAFSLALSACGGGDGATDDDDPIAEADAVVREGLTSEHEFIRAETIRLIGVLAAGEFRDELDEALQDPSPVVQTAAIEALLKLGVRSVEGPALSRLVAGTVEQRRRLLDLVVQTGRSEFRSEVIGRALRDTSAPVQIAAMRHAVETSTTLGLVELERLLESDDDSVSAEAFLTLVSFDRPVALDLVLTMLRSSTDAERARGLRFARHLGTPNLWPMMRSLAAQEADAEGRRLALMVLGHLGDPIAEAPLRDILLSAPDDVAAQALAAISHIPTTRARDQPLVHRRDARRAVRNAALAQLVEQRRPTDDFELFLDDQDPDIAERALLHMQHSNPERAAQLFSRALADTDDPRPALYALYRVSLHHDIRRFLDATSAQLMRYLTNPDENISGLAARLLVNATSPVEMQNRIRRSETANALYALIEATFRAEGNFSSLYSHARHHDLHAIRIAAALGILELGDDYTPPVSTPDS